MKRLALLALTILVLPARACLNDRDSDSLATQAAQLPETLRVITGRFERNPPLYYQMRIERERAALKRNPRQFGLYDDIGVALDKLGKSDEALQKMAAKREVLPAFNPDDKANREAWYRTYANAGTFRAHRFLRAGAPKAKLGEMKTARAQIKRAIEIKPDAHFGRERYQLMAMDWVIARKSGATKKTLGEWVAGRDGWSSVLEDDESRISNAGTRKRAVKGLSGMVVLGGAWESPDMFEALGAALEFDDAVTLRHLALLRAEELIRAGKPSLGQLRVDSPQLNRINNDLSDIGVGVNSHNVARLEDLYLQLRTEADAWNRERQAWMGAKLKKGLHPDTNANFWSGYVSSQPPSLDIQWDSYADATNRAIIWAGVTLFSILVGITGVTWAITHWWRKRAQIVPTKS